MESKHVLFLFSLVIIAGILSPATLAARDLIGGYQPIKDIRNPHVVVIGDFAVNEYDKEHMGNLLFVEVVSGEKQVVNGVKYRLNVKAMNSSSSSLYQAIVLDKPAEQSRVLISFRALI